MSKTENKSWDFLWYALYAFAGLGLELLLLGLVEPVLFGGTASSDYSDTQRILHWLLTILCWGAMIALLTHFSKRKLQFDPLARRPFSKKGWVPPLYWQLCACCSTPWTGAPSRLSASGKARARCSFSSSTSTISLRSGWSF